MKLFNLKYLFLIYCLFIHGIFINSFSQVTEKTIIKGTVVDSKTGEIVLGTFQKLNEKLGRTIIIITHEQEVAEHADRILFIKDGGLVEDRTTHTKRVIKNI